MLLIKSNKQKGRLKTTASVLGFLLLIGGAWFGWPEEDVANEFVEAVEKAGLSNEEVKGVLHLYQSNPSGVCPTCLSGLGNPDKASGVIKQLSERYPNLKIKVSSNQVEGVRVTGRSNFTVQNGKYVD